MTFSRPRRRVAVIGNFSGRNAGDAAILDGLFRDVTGAFSDTLLRFDVPTINTKFVREAYATYPVHPIGLLPWNLSLKILGLPIVRTVLGADVVLVTDAILFDRKLYNPAFNYLWTLSHVLPLAARRGIPVVLYAVSLGPVTTTAGRHCMQRVLRSCQTVIVRDQLSADLARELHPSGPEPSLAADCALSCEPAPVENIDALMETLGLSDSGRPLLGVNVNAYMDAFVRGDGPGIQAERFQRTVAAVIDRAIRELDVDVVMVQTQAMDVAMGRGVLSYVEATERTTLITNREYGHRELAGLMGRVEAFVGMRTHSIILSTAQHTPAASLIAYPKTRGYLETVGCGDHTLDFEEFGEDSMWNMVRSLWERRDEVRARLRVTVERERAKAAAAATQLAPWLARA